MMLRTKDVHFMELFVRTSTAAAVGHVCNLAGLHHKQHLAVIVYACSFTCHWYLHRWLPMLLSADALCVYQSMNAERVLHGILAT